MFGKLITGTILATVASLATITPANATVTITFATFSAPNTAKNLRLVNSGNSAARTNDATIYTTTTGTSNGPGAVKVQFSFLQPYINTYVTNVTALFTLNATVAKGTPAVLSLGNLLQSGISGSFSFLTTSAITVGGPYFTPTTYAAGSNLLSGTFTNTVLYGSGSSAATTSSTSSGGIVTFTSDFLDFSSTVTRDRALALTAATPTLAAATGANKALKSFRATVGGQFSSDPAPLVNGLHPVPEPATWAMMIAGFAMIGGVMRRRPTLAVRYS